MMKWKFVVTAALLSVASPVLAQSKLDDAATQHIGKHRADAIQQCQQYADNLYGPSGVRDWRRYNHDTYSSCMADKGEPQ